MCYRCCDYYFDGDLDFNGMMVRKPQKRYDIACWWRHNHCTDLGNIHLDYLLLLLLLPLYYDYHRKKKFLNFTPTTNQYLLNILGKKLFFPSCDYHSPAIIHQQQTWERSISFDFCISSCWWCWVKLPVWKVSGVGSRTLLCEWRRDYYYYYSHVKNEGSSLILLKGCVNEPTRHFLTRCSWNK